MSEGKRRAEPTASFPPSWAAAAGPGGTGWVWGRVGTVSQIWSLICFLSIVTIRAPNSTPMVRSGRAHQVSSS